MPPQTRFTSDAGAPPLHQDYTGLSSSESCYVPVLIDGLLPTDVVQAASIVAKTSRSVPDSDPANIIKQVGVNGTDTNCTLTAVGPSKRVYLAMFWLDETDAATLLAQHVYDVYLSVLRGSIVITRRVQYGIALATTGMSDIGGGVVFAAALGLPAAALLATVGVSSGALLAVGVTVPAGEVAATTDPTVVGTGGLTAGAPQVRATAVATSGNSIAAALSLPAPAVDVTAAGASPLSVGLAAPKSGVEATAFASAGAIVGVAIKTPQISIPSTVEAGLSAALNTPKGQPRATAAAGQVSAAGIKTPAPKITVGASGFAGMSAAAGITLPKTATAVTLSAGGRVTVYSNAMTNATTENISTWNPDWVQVNTQGDYHEVTASYTDQHISSAGRVFTEYQGAGSPTGDQWIQADLLCGHNSLGLMVRGQGNGNGVLVEANAGAAFTVRHTPGGGVIHTFTSTLPNDSAFHTVYIEIQGSTLKLQVDGGTIESYTDSTYATGKPGIYTNNGTGPYTTQLKNVSLGHF